MGYNTFEKFKNSAKIFIMIFVFAIILFVLTHVTNNISIKNIKDFVSEVTKVLYISDSENYSSEIVEFFNKYDADYMYIDISKYSKMEQISLKKLIKEDNLKNIIIVFKNGNKLDMVLNLKSKNKFISFFQDYHIFPKIIEKNDKILDSVKEYITSQYRIIYIPYEYSEQVEKQDSILNNIANRYNIEYSLVNAYLLSDVQKEKLNSILQVSDVNNQIVILVKNNSILNSIRNVYDEKEYIEELYKSGFIDSKEDRIIEVNINFFEEIIKKDQKNVVFIEKNECKDCETVSDVLNEICNQNELEFYSINIVDFESDTYEKLKNKLHDLEYNDAVSVPLVIITESDKILDYTIGLSSEEYFLESFYENGIIKR